MLEKATFNTLEGEYMKGLLTFLMALSSLSSIATTTIKFQCSQTDVTYMNRFELTGEVEVYDSQVGSKTTRFWNENISFNLTNAGTNAQASEQIELNTSGEVKFFAPGTFSENNEVILVRALPKEAKGYFVNLLLDYPGNNSSKIRTADGREYKSTCKIVSKKSCIFGDSLNDLQESSKFTSKEIGDFFVASRIYEGTHDISYDEDFKPEVTKIEFTHKVTGNKYYSFNTFEDQWDGGNTIGWIENAAGNKVSSISDGDLYGCTAY